MPVQIKFCGAAGTVTGSCYWIRAKNCQFLVDCGLFQGTKTIKELNYRPFPFNAADIDFILLTHAHTDHAALLPKLIKAGFKGPVYTTAATRDLLSYMLPDSGYIQEAEVSRLNRRNLQRGHSAVHPIYTRKDAEESIHHIHAVSYETWLQPHPDIQAQFWNAGHILGSASIEIKINQTGEKLHLLFSGDIGPDHKLFHADPDAPKDFDYIFCEATYGGRNRDDAPIKQRRDILAQEINDAMQAGGPLIIPSFAVERTQELLLDIAYLLSHELIPCSSVFIDSPLAIRITSVFAKHATDLEDMGEEAPPFTHENFHFTKTAEESKSIARFSSGAIIMAASGMCDAGRIRHHLKNHLWRPQSTVLLVGYQAEGTLGQLLAQGIKRINIQGEAIKVRARIRSIDTYSGHADGEGLIAWVKARLPLSQGIFLTHGSEKALEAMRAQLLLEGFTKNNIFIPSLDEEYILQTSGKTVKQRDAGKRIDPKDLKGMDWHNELAQLTLDVRTSIERLPDDKQKEKLLRKLRRALQAAQ